MKKKIVAIFLMLALIISALGGTVAFAQVSLEECDRCFQTAISGLLESDDVGSNKVNAVRKPVYDIELQQLGYVYDFDLISGSGYAIIICDDGNYIAQEMVTSSESPYTNVGENEFCVYVNSMTYLKNVDGKFYNIETSTQLSAEEIKLLSDNAIIYKASSGLDFESVSVTVNYQTRTTDSKSLSRGIPNYTSPGGLESACAAVAASNLIGFYDRYYEDLIPNHAAGYDAYGFFLYNYADSYVYDAIRELYSDMDGSAKGINETNFKSGMKKYCAKRNLNCDFTQLVSSGKLNYSGVKQSILENKPVALLLSTYNMCRLNGYDSYDRYDYELYDGDHIMAGFGYCDLSYILTDGTSQTNSFIKVATGIGRMSEAYFNINYSTNINSAYKVYIH